MESWEGANYYTRNTTKWVQLMNLSTVEWGIGFFPANLVAIPASLNNTYNFPSDTIVIQNASKTNVGSRHTEKIIFGLVSGIVILWALAWLYVSRSEILSPRGKQNDTLSPHDAASQGTSVTVMTNLDDGFVKAADFQHQIQYFYYDSDMSMLEAHEKDPLTDEVSTQDIEDAGALCRKMYRLDMHLWSKKRARKVKPSDRNAWMHQSDAILVEVRRQVFAWQANLNDGSTAPASENEKRQLDEIVGMLNLIGPERYPNKQA
ncbi:hypothetical protein B0J13DRAFT_543572 [Dactylonectria estremocensis]|uniref:Uncharacterized protein n=1 Tax=Dactylonectria estremocensis TaxID=1079267 RepID=A0A9P9FA54_9HYPO|nr:hypothetical protein B0J13DRAFT_543572 [Dactylonectria estremocensis]